jgi:Cu+-exporting ATPase
MIVAMDERLIRIRIMDLGCVAEGIGLERTLVRTPGILGATVNPATETAYISYDGFRTSAERLRAAIVAAGFCVADPVVS